MGKKTVTAVILGIFLIFKAEASMVSFLVIETGLQNDTRRRQHSEQWENTLMDVFFDTGYIVSNATMMRLERIPSNGIESVIRVDLNDARAGGADFFIVTQLDYTQEIVYPDYINIFIYRLAPDGSTLIYANKLNGIAYRSAREEREGLRNTIMGFVPYLRN